MEIQQLVTIAGGVQQSSAYCLAVATAYTLQYLSHYLTKHGLHRGLEAGLDRMRRCANCSEVFCSLCSVPDYHEHDVRYFCLECQGM